MGNVGMRGVVLVGKKSFVKTGMTRDVHTRRRRIETFVSFVMRRVAQEDTWNASGREFMRCVVS